MNTVGQIREQFPALAQEVWGKPLVYLDNGATSQKPQCVLSLLTHMNTRSNANVHRAMHRLSDEATGFYEAAREKVREFIHAPERECIIFTSGTTASINLVASSFCRKFLHEGEAVVISGDSHHSNIVPWQLACETAGAELRVIPVKDSGEWDMEVYRSLLDDKVKIVALEHISNILGLVNPLEEAIAAAHAKGIPVLVDGAQGIVHEKVDVQRLDCDFYAFSGHKIYAETGSGILYGKKELLERMPPYMGGGDMVGTVTYERTTYAELPLKFEAGTPNFIAQATLKPALEFVEEIRGGDCGQAVEREQDAIVAYLREALGAIPGCRIYGDAPGKIALFSFNVDGCFPSDLAQLLDKMGVAVRTGSMCCEPLMSRFGVTSMVRASFLPYNTLEEARYFIRSLNRAVNMLR